APLDADLFGTDRRQKIGATWPINKEAAVAALKGMAADFTADQLTGGGKLLRPVNVNGVDCLELQLTQTVKQPTAGNPPKGMKGVASSFQRTITETFPADYRTGPVRRVTRVEMHEQFQGIPGTQIDDVVTNQRLTETAEEKIKYLAKE